MATTIKVINADVSVDRSYVYELAKQYDNLSRKYRIIITDKGVPVTLTGQESILMRMQAEGESTPYVAKWLDWEEGNPVVIMTSTMLSKIGVVHFEFVIYDAPGGTALLSTRQCGLKIQESLINYDGLIASEDFDILSNLIAQALVFPQLISDANTGIEEMNTLITSVNTQMTTYQTEFNTMSANVQSLLDAVTAYMSNAENAAATSATLSKSFAIGTTGTRPGEDTDNGKYYWEQAKFEADKAATYSSVVAPMFHLDFNTMELIQDTSGTNVTFTLDENKVLSFVLA